MKHIKEILQERQRSLFAMREKGSREWSAFDVVRDDHVDMFQAGKPRTRTIKIEYRELVPVRPRHITPRPASN